MDGWVGGRAGFRISSSDQKSYLDTTKKCKNLTLKLYQWHVYNLDKGSKEIKSWETLLPMSHFCQFTRCRAV